MKYLALDCQEPQGGQAGLRIGEQPEVAFIVTMHNHGNLAAQCLLELFRCKCRLVEGSGFLFQALLCTQPSLLDMA